MSYEREAYAPWSLTRKAGVQSATVDSDIKVPQNIQPVLSTGFVDYKGNWKGTTSSDETFFIDAPHEDVANSATVLVPQTADRDFIDMTGFNDIFIAIRPTNTGNYAITGAMGYNTNGFANLTPLNESSSLGGNVAGDGTGLYNLFHDDAQALTADVWNIFIINNNRLSGQKNMQFKITNNSGDISTITFAYMRLV